MQFMQHLQPPSKEVSIKVNVLIVAQNAMQVLGEQASSLKPNTNAQSVVMCSIGNIVNFEAFIGQLQMCDISGCKNYTRRYRKPCENFAICKIIATFASDIDKFLVSLFHTLNKVFHTKELEKVWSSP